MRTHSAVTTTSGDTSTASSAPSRVPAREAGWRLCPERLRSRGRWGGREDVHSRPSVPARGRHGRPSLPHQPVHPPALTAARGRRGRASAAARRGTGDGDDAAAARPRHGPAGLAVRRDPNLAARPDAPRRSRPIGASCVSSKRAPRTAPPRRAGHPRTCTRRRGQARRCGGPHGRAEFGEAQLQRGGDVGRPTARLSSIRRTIAPAGTSSCSRATVRARRAKSTTARSPAWSLRAITAAATAASAAFSPAMLSDMSTMSTTWWRRRRAAPRPSRRLRPFLAGDVLERRLHREVAVVGLAQGLEPRCVEARRGPTSRAALQHDRGGKALARRRDTSTPAPPENPPPAGPPRPSHRVPRRRRSFGPRARPGRRGRPARRSRAPGSARPDAEAGARGRSPRCGPAELAVPRPATRRRGPGRGRRRARRARRTRRPGRPLPRPARPWS